MLAIPKMVNCLQHEAYQVRFSALRALGEVAAETSLLYEVLIKALEEDDGKVFQMAMSMLVSNSHSEMTETVTCLLQDSDKTGDWYGPQLTLIKGIAKQGSFSWIPELLDLKKGFFSPVYC